MKQIRVLILGIIVMLSFSVMASERARIGEKAPEFSIVDSNGRLHNLKDYAGKTVVLEWINFDCPFVHKHYKSGNMQRLQSSYTEKGVIWLSVCSSAEGKQGYFSGDDLKKRINDEKSAAHAYLVDTEGTVGRMYGARTTPHMFVIDAQGVLVYAGAIDDNPGRGEDTIVNAENHVVKVLDSILAGNESPLQASRPYGCSVKY